MSQMQVTVNVENDGERFVFAFTWQGGDDDIDRIAATVEAWAAGANVTPEALDRSVLSHLSALRTTNPSEARQCILDSIFRIDIFDESDTRVCDVAASHDIIATLTLCDGVMTSLEVRGQSSSENDDAETACHWCFSVNLKSTSPLLRERRERDRSDLVLGGTPDAASASSTKGASAQGDTAQKSLSIHHLEAQSLLVGRPDFQWLNPRPPGTIHLYLEGEPKRGRHPAPVVSETACEAIRASLRLWMASWVMIHKRYPSREQCIEHCREHCRDNAAEIGARGRLLRRLVDEVRGEMIPRRK